MNVYRRGQPNKGDALLKVMEQVAAAGRALSASEASPHSPHDQELGVVYMGDDENDESAFKALLDNPNGMSVVVDNLDNLEGAELHPNSKAKFHLESIDNMLAFLDLIIDSASRLRQ